MGRRFNESLGHGLLPVTLFWMNILMSTFIRQKCQTTLTA